MNGRKEMIHFNQSLVHSSSAENTLEILKKILTIHRISSNKSINVAVQKDFSFKY